MVAAAAVVLTPVGAAMADPARPGNAYQTIGQLEASGYDVVIDRVGSAPIGECFVSNVRNPQEVTRTVSVGKGKDREFITVVVSRSITVSLNCDV
jgi:hypothetical protein